MLVESKKNPQRAEKERKDIPETQYGYHFESII
jgi:hypothetical protein